MRIAGEERWIAAEDGGLYRDALGVPPPCGLPDAFLGTVEEPMAHADAPLRAHPRAVPDRAAAAPLRRRPDAGPEASSRRRASWSAASCCPGGTEREWCDPDVLRRLRRASLAVLRKEVEAADTAELARFLPSWQNVDAYRPAGAGPDRLREALVPLQGVALTPEAWERDVLPRRLGAYSPTWLDQLSTGGEIVWIGAGPLGRTGRVAFYFREDVRLAGPPPANAKLDRPEGEIHDAIRERLAQRPAFWIDLVADARRRDREELHSALWDLAWAGEVTNDAFAPLRAPRLKAVGARRRAPRRVASAPRRNATGQAVAGRWSLTEALFRDAPAAGPAAARAGGADARALRDRHPRDGRSPRAFPAASQPSTASSPTSRCSAPRGAATSSRASAARSSRSPGAVERLRSPAARRRGATSCWPPPTPPSPTARAAARGRKRDDGEGRAAPAEPRRRRLRPASRRRADRLRRARRQGHRCG